jgi:hypothetical protein
MKRHHSQNKTVGNINRSILEGEYRIKEERDEKVREFKSSHFQLGFGPCKFLLLNSILIFLWL